jgi:hypothetical protein
MEELLKDLREVCEKHGLNIEKGSEMLYVNKTVVDVRQRYRRRLRKMRCAL